LIERGHLAALSIRMIRGVFASVDARFEGAVTWRGGLVDRLLDERHAQLVGQIAAMLEGLGWEVAVEVTFSVYGDRGSVDIMAVLPSERLALIIEVKTELTSIEGTIRRLDVKDRLGAAIVRERFGWEPAAVSRLLVVLDGATSRRRVAAHDRSLRVAFQPAVWRFDGGCGSLAGESAGCSSWRYGNDGRSARDRCRARIGAGAARPTPRRPARGRGPPRPAGPRPEFAIYQCG
jgi:hypothetical protein